MNPPVFHASLHCCQQVTSLTITDHRQDFDPGLKIRSEITSKNKNKNKNENIDRLGPPSARSAPNWARRLKDQDGTFPLSSLRLHAAKTRGRRLLPGPWFIRCARRTGSRDSAARPRRRCSTHHLRLHGTVRRRPRNGRLSGRSVVPACATVGCIGNRRARICAKASPSIVSFGTMLPR